MAQRFRYRATDAVIVRSTGMTPFRQISPFVFQSARVCAFGLLALSAAACGGKKDREGGKTASSEAEPTEVLEGEPSDEVPADEPSDAPDEDEPSDAPDEEPTDEEPTDEDTPAEEPEIREPLTPMETEDGLCPEGALIDVATDTCLVSTTCPLGYAEIELDGTRGCEATPFTDQFGSEAHEVVVAIERDLDRNTIVLGSTGGRIEGNGGGGFDLFVRVYDEFGEVLWTRQFGSEKNDTATDLALGEDGRIFVVGQSFVLSDVPDTEDIVIEVSEQDGFIYCLSQEGETMWHREIATEMADSAAAVAVDVEGNAYVTGTTEGALTGVDLGGESNVFLVKYDALGDEQSVKVVGSPGRDSVSDLIIDDGGNLFMTGWTAGNTEAAEYPGPQLFVTRSTPTLETLWSRKFATASDAVAALALTDDGTLYVAGTVTGELGDSSFGGKDFFVRAYTSQGELKWTRQYGTEGQDELTALALGPDGLIYFAGETMGSFGVDKSGKLDGFYGVLTPSGEFVDIRDFGTAEDDTIKALAVDVDGAAYLGGGVGEALPGKEHLGVMDAYLAKVAFD